MHKTLTYSCEKLQFFKQMPIKMPKMHKLSLILWHLFAINVESVPRTRSEPGSDLGARSAGMDWTCGLGPGFGLEAQWTGLDF